MTLGHQIGDSFVTPREVIENAVAAILSSHGVTWKEFIAQDRRRKMVRVRAQVCRYLRAQGWSFPRIGRYIKRDHSSVLNIMGKYVTDDEQRFYPPAQSVDPEHRDSEDGVREPDPALCETDRPGEGD